MGRPAEWMQGLTGRASMRSPGKPSLRRDVERQFWCEIAKGLTSEDAALAVGASQAAGSRWFRERGGMPTFMTVQLTGRYLSFPEREAIAVLKGPGRRGSRDRPAGWAAIPRRSRGSCAATQPRAVAGWTIGHRSRSGGRAAGQAAQDRKAGEERSATGVCARPVVRPAPPARRDTGRGSGDGAVEGPDLLA
jgi:hypothetical protein